MLPITLSIERLHFCTKLFWVTSWDLLWSWWCQFYSHIARLNKANSPNKNWNPATARAELSAGLRRRVQDSTGTISWYKRRTGSFRKSQTKTWPLFYTPFLWYLYGFFESQSSFMAVIIIIIIIFLPSINSHLTCSVFQNKNNYTNSV